VVFFTEQDLNHYSIVRTFLIDISFLLKVKANPILDPFYCRYAWSQLGQK